MKVNTRSIAFRMWVYFAGFSVVLILTLWLLQTVFLSHFYEGMKTKDIAKTAQYIASQYGSADFENQINILSFRNSLLIYVTDLQGNVINYSDEHGIYRGNGAGNGHKNEMLVSIRPLPRGYNEFLSALELSGENFIVYKIEQDKFAGTSLIYGLKLDNAVLYISTALEPIGSTIAVLRRQLVYVTVIALFLSFVIAIFISQKLSRPIAKISSTASKLATGEYNITFEKGAYAEIDELANTLNYATSELSKVESLRRELIANISHDFRTPLTMIKAYAEMIRDISGDNKQKRELHLSVITDESRRLETLVNDVLDLSLLQSGNQVLNLQSVNVSELLQKISHRFKPLAKQNGYLLSFNIEPDQYCLADSARIEQVFYNLISNAINHSGQDKIIHVTLINMDNYVHFEVKDNGNGIAKEEIPLIWERYYKTRTAKNTTNSTGLGLSIVKDILELHKAKYGVFSSVGEGSTFWFELIK